jgi:D-alanyl-D-alanine dipeptidase
MRTLIILVSSFIVGCSSPQNNENTSTIESDSIVINSDSLENVALEPQYIIDTLEQSILDAGLVNIQDVNPEILVELRYSTTNNFMEKDVYGHLNRAYMQVQVAEDLNKCQTYLKSKDSTLTLLVYDAVRPRSVQQYMWDVLDMPTWEKTKFVSNPKNGSLHNYGCAVDLTIADLEGNALDMGAGYDDIRQIAYPRYESAYLDSGLLSTKQIENRALLREVMRSGGFSGIQTEWWHFNRYSRDRAKSLYDIIE